MLSIFVLTFALSWLVPAMILAAPMLARTYIHIWKVVLGMEPDCAFPAATFRLGKPDCLMPEDSPRSNTPVPTEH